MSSDTPKPFEIHTAQEWIHDYGAGAENYVGPVLDPKNVPSNVRCLIDIAAEWGIADEVTRNDKLDKSEFETVRSVYNRLKRHRTAYLNYRDDLSEKFRALKWESLSLEERCFFYLSAFYAEVGAHVHHHKLKK